MLTTSTATHANLNGNLDWAGKDFGVSGGTISGVVEIVGSGIIKLLS